MEQKLSRNPLAFIVVLASFAWNIALLVGVVLNAGFAHTRAAGGQYTDFPSGIRVLYVFQLALVIYQVWIFKLIFHTVLPPNTRSQCIRTFSQEDGNENGIGQRIGLGRKT